MTNYGIQMSFFGSWIVIRIAASADYIIPIIQKIVAHDTQAIFALRQKEQRLQADANSKK